MKPNQSILSVEQFKKVAPGKESDLQRSCITWFRAQYPHLRNLLFAIPNGGKRDAREARNLKMQGVTPGVPDLFLAVPLESFSGLFLELKSGRNKPTDLQVTMMAQLRHRGYFVQVIRSLEEFKKNVDWYLLPGYKPPKS